MQFDKTQKRALVFVAGLLGLSWYMGGQYEKADMMRSETDAYTYAYNEGHSDSRKNEGYQPTMENQKEESRFRKILKQRAETFGAENMLYILEHYTVNWREGGDSVEYHIGTSLMNLADALTDALDTLEEHNRHEEWCEDAKTDEEYEDRVERWKGRDGEDENGLLDLLMEVQGDGYGSDNLNRYTLTVKEAPVHLRGSSDYLYYAETFNAPYAGSGSLMNIGQDTSLGNFTSKELTESSAVHGDFNEASLNYSGHQNLQVRGVETFDAEALARDWKWKGIGWTPEEEATLSREEKEAVAEQLYNDWRAGKIKATDVDEYYERLENGAETMTPSEVKVKVTKDVTPKGSKIIVEECVDIQAHKADATANFYRVRFRDPTEMSNFRVPAWAARAANTMGSKYYDVAGSKVTMGQDKSGNWKIQSVMVPKRADVDVELALKIANHIQDRLEKEGRWASKVCQDNERILIIR